jgi:hypothetical protein
MKIKTKRTRSVASGSAKRPSKRPDPIESLKQELEKKAKDSAYLDIVDELDDSQIRATINATMNIPVANTKGGGAKIGKIVTDSATGVMTQSPSVEFNGPIPLGFRSVPPSHLLGLKGPMGRALKHFGARNFFLGDQVNAWFDQNCFVNKADSMPGEDAVSAGYDFSPMGKKDKKLVSELELMFNTEEFNLNETMMMFDHNKRCFGAALMIPCFEETVDMSVPLVDYSQLKGKTFLGWTNIEPYYLCPMFDPGSRELEDPTYKFYMVPTRWIVYGGNFSYRKCDIHRSWTFFRRHVPTSKIYQPQYKWQGPSVPQMILERLYSAEVCANESSMLLRSKRSFVMEADVRKMAANPEWARKFLQNCTINSNNWGIRVVPQNSNAKQMDSYLSECMPLTTAQYGILCAEVDIPAPKFMMAQLTGFANSGNYEVKLYAQKEKILQKTEMIPIVKQTCKIATACETGKPVEMEVCFGDVDVPTVTERAEIMYEEARAAKFLEEAKAFKRGEKGAGSHHNLTE